MYIGLNQLLGNIYSSSALHCCKCLFKTKTCSSNCQFNTKLTRFPKNINCSLINKHDKSLNQTPTPKLNFIYLQTSEPLLKVDVLMTSGAIHAYVPAAEILVVWLTSRARPKSVIFNVFNNSSSFFSTLSEIRTEK